MIDNRRAPVQGYRAGIPWYLHLRAYDAYCKKWSPQPAMIDYERGCRGGFHAEELDDLIPGWREEVSEITALRSRIETLEKTLDEALGYIDALSAGGIVEIMTEMRQAYPRMVKVRWSRL